MSAKSLFAIWRDIRDHACGKDAPHVASSREERDLAHAGYNASLKLTLVSTAPECNQSHL